MLKRWTEIWSSFPAAHKRRCTQGLAAYALLTTLCVLWISTQAGRTLESLQAEVPSVTATVRNVYTTPQITSVSGTAAPPANPLPPVVDDGRTYISVIISNLGLSSLETQRAIEDLPAQFTLAFSPYTGDVRSWVSKAVAANHEALMLVPMETADYPENDPGPRALSSRLSDKANNANLEWLLSRGDGTDGVMNMMGSRYLTDKKRLFSTFTTLRGNDAMFIETPGIEDSTASAAAAQTGLPFMQANLRIDKIPTDDAISDQLSRLESDARKYGYAIGIAQPYPVTLNILKAWAAGLAAKGIILAPLKTIWRHKKHYIPKPSSPATAPVKAADAASPPVAAPSAVPPPQSQLRQP